jgi:peptide deformylase
LIRPILRYPDKGLRTAAAAVTAFDADLAALAADLHETMLAAPGIGITAPHVGVPLRLVVVQLEPGDPVRVFVNPVVTEASAETRRHAEGSVSMPGATEEVERPARVRVAWRSLDGEPREAWMEGLDAVVLQHEIDQLDGIFWIDRLSRLKRERLVKRWEKSGRR